MSRWDPRTLRQEARRKRDAGRPLPGTAPSEPPPPDAAGFDAAGLDDPPRNGALPAGPVSNGTAEPGPAAYSSFQTSLESARRTSPSGPEVDLPEPEPADAGPPEPDQPEAPEIEALRAAGATVGQRVVLEHGAYVDADFAWLVTIEDDAVLGPRAQVLAHDGATRQTLGHTLAAPVRIGAGAYVGAGATILPGVTVGRYAVVGAGSIVSRDVEPETVVAGIPARAICSVRELMARQESDVEAAKAAGLFGLTIEECRDPEHRAELLARMRRTSRIYVR